MSENPSTNICQSSCDIAIGLETENHAISCEKALL